MDDHEPLIPGLGYCYRCATRIESFDDAFTVATVPAITMWRGTALCLACSKANALDRKRAGRSHL